MIPGELFTRPGSHEINTGRRTIYEVSLAWQNGKLLSATVKNISGNGPVKLRYGRQTTQLNLPRGAEKTLGAGLE